MTLSHELSILKDYRGKHLQLGSEVMEADNGNIFLLDLLIISTLNRSMCLLKGFVELIETKNFISASPLVRLQLDNGLRLFAGTIVNDPHDFSKKIMEGIAVKDQKDINGKSMTDFYLVDKLSNFYPWIKEVYNQTSGYVHLSEKHFWNAISVTNETGKIKMKITDVDAFVTDKDYKEAVISFRKATDIVFDHVKGWVYSKSNPGIMDKRIDNLK